MELTSKILNPSSEPFPCYTDLASDRCSPRISDTRGGRGMSLIGPASGDERDKLSDGGIAGLCMCMSLSTRPLQAARTCHSLLLLVLGVNMAACSVWTNLISYTSGTGEHVYTAAGSVIPSLAAGLQLSRYKSQCGHCCTGGSSGPVQLRRRVSGRRGLRQLT